VVDLQNRLQAPETATAAQAAVDSSQVHGIACRPSDESDSHSQKAYVSVESMLEAEMA